MRTPDKPQITKALVSARTNDLKLASIDALDGRSIQEALAQIEAFIRSTKSNYTIIAIRKR